MNDWGTYDVGANTLPRTPSPSKYTPSTAFKDPRCCYLLITENMSVYPIRRTRPLVFSHARRRRTRDPDISALARSTSAICSWRWALS